MNIRKLIMLLAAVPVGLVTIAAHEPTAPQRLTPADILAIAHQGASAGSSGVAGIETRVLEGDPTKAGLYTIQLSVPAHTTIQAHEHPDNRVATVVSGTWYFGYGAKFDERQLKALPPGSFYVEAPHAVHFASTGDTPVVVHISGVGPTGTKYVEAAK